MRKTVVCVLLLAVGLGCFVNYRNSYIGISGYGFSTTAEEVTVGLDLTQKTVLITGATSGLGKETARVLAKAGATVFLCGRTTAKAEKAIASLDKTGFKGKLRPFECDLSSIAAVTRCGKAFAATGSRLDHLILNAGVAWLPGQGIRLSHSRVL